MMLYGSTFVFTKVVYKYYQPLTTIFIRLLISTSLLFLIMLVSKKFEKIKVQDFKYFLLLALLEPFLYFLGESFALQIVSSTTSSVIISTIPVFTPLAAFFMLREKISLMNIFGIFVSFSGVLVLIFNKDFSLIAPLYGILLLFVAVFSAVFASVYIKKLSHHYSSFTIIAYINLIGAVMFLPLFLIFDFRGFIKTPINFELLSSILYLAIFASSIAFILYTKAVRHLGVNKTNVFSNTIPIFTAIFSYIIIHESITFNKIIGMLIVIIGVFLSQMKRNRLFRF